MEISETDIVAPGKSKLFRSLKRINEGESPVNMTSLHRNPIDSPIFGGRNTPVIVQNIPHVEKCPLNPVTSRFTGIGANSPSRLFQLRASMVRADRFPSCGGIGPVRTPFTSTQSVRGGRVLNIFIGVFPFQRSEALSAAAANRSA